MSAAGKTTLGQALADALGYAFIEGDTPHAAANVARMAAGTPLDDADRWPWLERGPEPVAFVYPVLSRAALQARLRVRHGHFMPASLIDRQLSTLESPAGEEMVVELEADQPIADLVATVLSGLHGLA